MRGPRTLVMGLADRLTGMDMGPRGGPILIVYYARVFPLRATIYDHLYSFRRYAGRPCFYLNMAERKPAPPLRRVQFALVIFHTTFLSQRWSMPHFRRLLEKLSWVRELPAVKIALPQDEFLQSDALCDFIHAFGVSHLFSVMPESAWPRIYPGLDQSRVRVHGVLTGYLEPDTVARILRLAASTGERTFDIGYRAWQAAPWLGRHGMLKDGLATVFRQRAPQWGLRVDISTRDEDVLLGDRWHRFLLRCKYTLGVEGGASILDRDGEIRRRTEAYLQDHPTATFDEVERECFSGLDGAARLVALSPRHLEACATRTCQVLIEGEYNGILRPGVHYIELRQDFSNLDEVCAFIKRDEVRMPLTERAYLDIVASSRYTYERFVRFVLETALISEAGLLCHTPARRARTLSALARSLDRASQCRVRLALWWERLPQRIPAGLLGWLLRARRLVRRPHPASSVR